MDQNHIKYIVLSIHKESSQKYKNYVKTFKSPNQGKW
jgi:hypothetical protein